MLIDLAILTIVGFLGELLGEYIINISVIATWVTGSISLLVLLVTTTRWGWKGLVPIPFLALAIVISGHFFIRNPNYRENYDWKLYIAIVISFLSMAINLLWMKKIGYKETFKKPLMMLALCSLDYLLVQLSLSLVFWMLTQKFLLLAFLMWNAFSYAILLVGCFVLSRQNILVDIKLSLLEREEERKQENDFKLQFEDVKIEENVDQEGVSKNGKNS